MGPRLNVAVVKRIAVVSIPALLAVLAYWPGLSGGFLFDDFNNLSNLGAYGRIDNWRSFVFYITSGEADPIGRPLSLLSFLADANNWPAEPGPFKRSNLVLHLLNGTLLFWVLHGLGRAQGLLHPQAWRSALLGAALWLLHPFFVSTTLYVVQREAMLPATFTLIGMGTWLVGRRLLSENLPRGLAWLTFSSLVCTGLAVLSKANGIVLPLLLLIMQWQFPGAPVGTRTGVPPIRWLTWVLLGIPSVALALWLLLKIPTDISFVPLGRPFSVGQRLITEPRVLLGYLRLLWLPQASLSGLFNDGLTASKDLFHPISTLISLICVVVLIGIGLSLPRRQAPIAFAILFFFGGHLLESSVIPLELSFEHRNYLPAMPLFWPLAIWLTGSGAMPRLRMGLCVAIPIALALLTHSRAASWGRPSDLALLFAEASPDSPRAQVNAATYEASLGHLDVAILRLEDAARRFPSEPQVSLNLLTMLCSRGSVPPAALDAVKHSIAGNTNQAEFIQHWVVDHIPLALAGKCSGFNLESLKAIQSAVRENPSFSKAAGHQRDLDDGDGRIALAAGDASGALLSFNKAIADLATPDVALAEAALLGSAGFPELGLEHLQYFEALTPTSSPNYQGMLAVHAYLLERLGYWNGELARVEGLLREDAAEKIREQAPATGSRP